MRIALAVALLATIMAIYGAHASIIQAPGPAAAAAAWR